MLRREQGPARAGGQRPDARGPLLPPGQAGGRLAAPAPPPRGGALPGGALPRGAFGAPARARGVPRVLPAEGLAGQRARAPGGGAQRRPGGVAARGATHRGKTPESHRRRGVRPAARGAAGGASAATPGQAAPRGKPLDEAERSRLETALRENGGNVAATARALGLHRTQLRRLLERHGLAGAGEG
ncbi:helix-turn-helix domain-containing protein [Myxococcus sp. 1LA]